MYGLYKKYILILVLMLAVVQVHGRATDRHHIYAEISNVDKATIIIQRLDKALNESNIEKAFAILDKNSIDDEGNKLTLKSQIINIISSLKTDGESDKSIMHKIHLLLTQNPVIQDDTLYYSVLMESEYDNHTASQDVTLKFVEKMKRLYLVNSDDLLDQLEAVSKTLQNQPIDTTLQILLNKSITKSSKDLSSLFSHKAFYYSANKSTTIDVFNRTVAQAQFDGNSIFSRPYDILESIVFDDDLGDYWGMISSDASWDRFVAFAEQGYSGMPAVFAKTEYEAPQFDTSQYAIRYPLGVSLLTDQDLYICNPLHDLVSRYYINLNTPSLDNEYAIGGIDYDGIPLNKPVDVDAAHIPLYLPENYNCNFHNWVAICDQLNNRIVITSFQGGIEAVVGEYGVGDFKLRHPTSVAFARDWQTGWQTHNIYVADDGNKRIVKFESSTFGDYDSFIETDDTVFSADASINSVDVDGFGQVYALDTYNGKIYKFDEDLNLIATWGQIGADVNSMYYPNRFAITRGWENEYVAECDDIVLVPKRMGEILVTESFTETTGLKRFVMNNEMADFVTSYIPRNCDYDTLIGNYVTVDWYQADYATVRIILSISNYGTAVDYSSLFIPGDHGRNFGLPPDIPQTGTYTVDIYLISEYTGEIVQHETSSGPYDHGDCNYPPTIVSGPFITGNDSCFMYNVWPPYECGVDVIDPDDSTQDLLYTFVTEWCDEEKRIGLFRHPDSASNPFPFYTDSVVTHCNRVLLVPDKGALPNPPSCPSLPEIKVPANVLAVPDLIFSVKVQDPHGGWTERRFTEGDLPFGLGTNTCDPDPEPDTPKVGCPILYIEENGEWKVVNNILAESEDPQRANEYVNEIYPLYLSSQNNGEFHLRIAEETEDEITTLKSIRATVINYPNSENIIFTADNELYSLDTIEIKPTYATDALGNDITELLMAQDNRLFTDDNSGSVTIEYSFDLSSELGAIHSTGGPGFPPANKNFLKPVIRPGDDPVCENSLFVMKKDGSWLSAGKAFPRYFDDQRPVELSDYIQDGRLVIKIEYGNNIQLDYTPYRFYKSIEATPVYLRLESVRHNKCGDVTNVFSSSGSSDITLEEGQYIDVVFEGNNPTDGNRQLLLFASQGKYEKKHGFDAVSEKPEFGHNYPNPFNPTTTFSFSIPSTQWVKLEVFNILGQRVIVLQDNELSAGRYEIIWDSKDSRGDQVASGVYFARFTAGEYTASRKLEVLK
ncbi:MAG: T9SS type A sorting domain-containing protein [Candidatus Zixiibacteriota bacterium]